MAVQPKYHWQFEEGQGTTSIDAVNGIQAKLSNTTWLGRGRIGNAIKIDGKVKNSRIVLGNEPSRFGTSDFTVAFGMKILDAYGQKALHVIGNRSTAGHGNFFSIRLKNQKQLTFEVDENTRGKNYAFLDSKRSLNDGKWHHITAVRQGRSLKLYIDGELSDESVSKTGIANITTDAALLLGARGLRTAIAQYEDLRIYHTALNAADVRALVPPVNPPLRDGEIELVAADDAAIILTQNVEDLTRFSTSFKKLRIGKNTGVTLYQRKGFSGTAQKCYADLPDIRFSRLKTFPKSIRIGSSIGEPFTGKWIIKAPNGQFLSLGHSILTTAPRRSFNELFTFHHNLQQAQLQLMPGSNQESACFKLSPEADPTYLFIDDSDSLQDEFSIINQANNQWLALRADNTFKLTEQKGDRAVFIRVAKMADNEGQVGELAPGEVALYEHMAYHGKTWILSDNAKDVSGQHTRFGDFHHLNDKTSSIRLGPDTGVTLFKHFNYRAAEDKREEEIEDIIKNVPDLRESQIGNDALSSIQIFRTIDPEDVLTSYTTKLSQDYRMVGDQLEEFSSYRTILRFEPGAGEIELSATDLTQIEVEGRTYDIDETRSVTLSPNEMNRIMITSEADGINTPGLKIRTRAMALNERIIIFPNQEAHQQIAELEEGALWNATDAQGNLIVDREAHSQEEVASVQNTIKRVMGTVSYTGGAPAQREGTIAKSRSLESRSVKSLALESRSVRSGDRSRVQLSERVVSGATLGNPWKLELNSNTPKRSVRAAISTANVSQLRTVSTATVVIQEVEMSQDEFSRLFSQAIPEETTPVKPPVSNLPGTISFIKIGNPFKKIKDAVKKATSVVIGVVEDVVNVIVDTAEGVFKFVVDTVEKVAEFVEAVVDKVVKSIKQFIEFLQFLFDWNDILETQRYLVRAINTGFDYAAQQVDAAKGPVSDFMNSLQETVEGGMNDLVAALGVEPSEVRESESQLPEAAEWFLSKLLGGSKKDDADITPQSETPSGDSELENFLFHFAEAFKDSSGAVLRGFEGIGETVETLIKNPRQPQRAVAVLIESFRDVIIQMLESVENLALGFLDVMAEAIEQIKKLLNAEIKIPFISDLFKLIGGGKLTLLNLACLLLAIPVTVVSKLLFNEKPFKGELPLDFSTQRRAKSVITEPVIAGPVVARPVAQPVASVRAADKNARANSIRHWGNAGLLADVMNGVITGYLDVLPEGSDKAFEDTAGFGFEMVSLVLSGISWLASFPSSPDFPGGRPYNLAAHPVSKSKNKPEYRERVMWGWRTALYWLDVVILAGKGVAALKGKKPRLQRIKRADEATIAFFFGTSVIDLVLTKRYLNAIPPEDQSDLEVTNEMVAIIPNLLCVLRLMGPKGAAALTIVDAVAAFANYSMGHALLTQELASL